MFVHVAPVRLAASAFASCAPTSVVTAYCGPQAALDRRVLHLPLADVITPPDVRPCRRPSQADIRAIIDWISREESGASVLCMCRAGLSRSPALALVASEVLVPGSSLRLWTAMRSTGYRITPNPEILRQGSDYLGGIDNLEALYAEALALRRSTDTSLPRVLSFELASSTP